MWRPFPWMKRFWELSFCIGWSAISILVSLIAVVMIVVIVKLSVFSTINVLKNRWITIEQINQIHQKRSLVRRIRKITFRFSNKLQAPNSHTIAACGTHSSGSVTMNWLVAVESDQLSYTRNTWFHLSNNVLDWRGWSHWLQSKVHNREMSLHVYKYCIHSQTCHLRPLSWKTALWCKTTSAEHLVVIYNDFHLQIKTTCHLRPHFGEPLKVVLNDRFHCTCLPPTGHMAMCIWHVTFPCSNLTKTL